MDRHAHLGAAVAFGVTGLVAATYAGRVPEVADRLGLSPGGLAVAAFGIEGGALLGLPLGAALVARHGTRTTLRAAFAVFAPGVAVAALAPSLTWLALGLAGWAAANSVVDVALNTRATELEHHHRRPLLSRLHAGQGAGLLLGALIATAAAAWRVPLVVHLVAVGCAGLAAGLLATASMPAAAPSRTPSGPTSRTHRPDRGLLLLGAVAFCAFLLDGAATNWIAAHLVAGHGAGAGTAACGYLLFTAALVLGRLGGDRLTARLSRHRAVLGCGLATGLGATTACLAPTLPIALAGWVLVGLAVAPLAPAVLGAAPAVTGAPPPAAIAAVTTIGYLGSFTGPPLIGALAEVTTLSGALVLLAAAGAGAALLAGPALRGVRR